jgi:hypothetical protein
MKSDTRGLTIESDAPNLSSSPSSPSLDEAAKIAGSGFGLRNFNRFLKDGLWLLDLFLYEDR